MAYTPKPLGFCVSHPWGELDSATEVPKDATYTVHQLRVVALRNPIVNAALKTWESGGFESLEQCLIALALHLTEANEQLVKDAVERAKRYVPPPPLQCPNPFTTPEPGVWVNPVYDDSLRSMVRSRIPDPPVDSARLMELVEKWRAAIASGSEPMLLLNGKRIDAIGNVDECHVVTE